MQLYWFKPGIGQDTYALSTVADGANLPDRKGGWVKQPGIKDVQPGTKLIGGDSDKILADISKQGYHIANIKIDISVKEVPAPKKRR